MSAPTPDGDRPDVTLVVLAAGRATRYGGVKPLAPVGVDGEAVLDLLASDALDAGFGRLVLVVGPDTGPALRYHLARRWPAEVPVEVALQPTPRGTVDAVLAAAPLLKDAPSFGVANADDLPGEAGLGLLAGRLRSPDGANAVVCYTLAASLLSADPVTRGLCRVDRDGMLVAVDERRGVAPAGDGRIVARDGIEPAELDPDQLVSVNLWGFRAEMLDAFRSAMAGSDGRTEVLLPVVVDGLLSGPGAGAPPTAVKVLRAPGRCIGVTHPGDVALVQSALAREVGRGERAARLWSALPTGR